MVTLRDLPNLTRGETTGLFLPPDRIRLHPPNGCGPLWMWRDRCEDCGARAVSEAERFGQVPSPPGT